MSSSDTTTTPNQQGPTFTSADDFLGALECADTRSKREKAEEQY